MRQFDDFDAWGDAVSGASLRLACDGIETRAWTLGIVDLGGVVLQVASEGGGNICYGGNAHVGTMLFLPLNHAAEHVVNGEPLDDDSLFVIPRGADFRIRVRRRAHAWCSIALPDGGSGGDESATASARVACGDGAVARLRDLVRSIADTLLDRPADTVAHAAAGRTLLAAATACLPGPREQRVVVGRPRMDRAEIIRRSMAGLDGGSAMPTTAELARAVGVTGRTLQRTFQESFGLSPKRYLLLRELHAIRRSLQAAAAAEDATVADVLVRHGVWEFGRFAARYRRHFGELPSATLRRARG